MSFSILQEAIRTGSCFGRRLGNTKFIAFTTEQGQSFSVRTAKCCNCIPSKRDIVPAPSLPTIKYNSQHLYDPVKAKAVGKLPDSASNTCFSTHFSISKETSLKGRISAPPYKQKLEETQDTSRLKFESHMNYYFGCERSYECTGQDVPDILQYSEPTKEAGNVTAPRLKARDDTKEHWQYRVEQGNADYSLLPDSALVPQNSINQNPGPEQMIEQLLKLSRNQQISIVEKENQPSSLNITDTQTSDKPAQNEAVVEMNMMHGHESFALYKEDFVRRQRKTRTQGRRAEKPTVIFPKSEDTAALFHSLFGNEYTEESTGARTIRQSGGKDRHSKVFTSKGPRDRRVRLSVSTAIQFYDVQDRLGFDQPSKAVEWLIKKAKSAIDELAQLPNLCLKRLKTAHYQASHHQGMCKQIIVGLSGTGASSCCCSNTYSCSHEKSSLGGLKLDGIPTQAFLPTNNQACEGKSNLLGASNSDEILQAVNADCWNQLKGNTRHQVVPCSFLEEREKEMAKEEIYDIRGSSSSAINDQYVHQDCFYGNSSVAQTGPTIATVENNSFNPDQRSAKKTAAFNCSAPSLVQTYCGDSLNLLPKIVPANPSQNWVQDQLLHFPVDQFPVVDALGVESSNNQLQGITKIQVQSSQFSEADFHQPFRTHEQNNLCYLKSFETLLCPEHCDFRDSVNSQEISWSELRKPTPIHHRSLSIPLTDRIARMTNQQKKAGQKEKYSSVKNLTRLQNSTVAEMPISLSSYTMTGGSDKTTLYDEYNGALPMG